MSTIIIDWWHMIHSISNLQNMMSKSNPLKFVTCQPVNFLSTENIVVQMTWSILTTIIYIWRLLDQSVILGSSFSVVFMRILIDAIFISLLDNCLFFKCDRLTRFCRWMISRWQQLKNKNCVNVIGSQLYTWSLVSNFFKRPFTSEVVFRTTCT